MKFNLLLAVILSPAGAQVQQVVFGQGLRPEQADARWNDDTIPAVKNERNYKEDVKKITIESNTRAPTGVDIDAIREAESEKDRKEQLQQQKQRSSSSCPAVVCACTMIDGEKNVICTDDSKPMDEIPSDVPGDTVNFDAAGNRLVSIHEADFAGLDFLKHLNLSSTSLSEIEQSAFHHLKNVEKLDMSKNTLERLNLQRLRNLQWLDLSYNRFKTLPKFEEDSGVYIPLEYLDISNNPFSDIMTKSLPDTLLALNISCFNSRTFESNAVDNLHQLRELTIRGFGCSRRLEVVERGAFSNNKELRVLDLRGNRIVAVPDVLPSSIVTFLLGSNEIKNLQVQCTLNQGDFYGDKSSAPEQLTQGVFGALTSLEELDLSHNKLRALCVNDFVGQYSLRSINMSNNFIDTIPETTFSFVEKLEILDLSFNQLKLFESFQDMPTVKELYMKKNSLYKVNDPGLLSSIVKLDLSYNNWNCDCNLKGLVAYLREPPENVEVIGLKDSSMYGKLKNYVCNMPLLWSNKDLNMIQIPELTCEREKIDEDNLPLMSIAAPISIVVILLVVILLVYCASKNRRTRSKQRQFGRQGHTNKHDEHVVASGGAAAKEQGLNY